MFLCIGEVGQAGAPAAGASSLRFFAHIPQRLTGLCRGSASTRPRVLQICLALPVFGPDLASRFWRSDEG